jgi:hypothetical protein
MTDDAAVVRLGAWSYRGGRRTRRNEANPREEIRKVREAAEARAKAHRDFLRIVPPAELLERPDELAPGQEWGLWVVDDALYEHLAVIGVRNGIVVAQTEDGQLLAVEQGQLLQRGHFLGWVR